MSGRRVEPAAGKAFLRPLPAKIQVEVTTRCNLRCAMCVKSAPGCDIPEADLSLDAFRNIAPALPSCEALVLSGIGEPLMHPGLPDMAAFARARMPETSLLGFQTNGLLLTPDMAGRLAGAGVDTLCLSVDALDGAATGGVLHGQGETARLARACDMLHRAFARPSRPLRLGVEFVLMADTAHQLPAVVRWAGEQGAAFVIVSHMLAYDAAIKGQSLFNPNTVKATAVFHEWKARAMREGLDIHDSLSFLTTYHRTDAQKRLTELARRMHQDAHARGVWLHLRNLLDWDRRDREWLEELYAEARAAARGGGLELRLPPLQAEDVRRCHFIEDGAAFVTARGDVSPCQFLWHAYACHMDGVQKHIRPVTFGNLGAEPLDAVWASPAYVDFRREVMEYAYPYCANCALVPCDDIIGDVSPFEADCLGGTVPCGHCLWCMGGLQCLL